MLPIIGPLVSAGANLLGGLLGNEAAAGQASAQRAWEQQMSSTSWQRGVADMRAAGINPMLAYMQGGASTPGGAMAGVPNPNVLGDTVGSAMSMMQQQKQLELMESQKFNTEMQGYGSYTDALVKQFNELPSGAFPAVDMPSGRTLAGGAGGSLRYQLQNSLLSANAQSAFAAARYANAGVGQRQALSSVGGVLQPLTDLAGEGTRGLVRLFRGVGGSSARSLLPPSSSVNNWSTRGTGRSF